ncbi:hypothetical protein ACIG5E_30005 [Kitasatospora sp. NPDC053057]|uniref:hypothetical protein n=1 Tax=Kitasatospora sp. NPDC053057 TaxID=3364062 RepID=UPI0037CBA83E
MKKQEALDKAVDRITGGQDEQNRDRIPGFSEVEVDPGANRITLHWKGELPDAVRGVLQDLPRDVSVQVVAAKYSKAELHAAREKLLSNGKPIPLPAKRPSHISSIGPSLDGSGLDLGYETDDERAPGVRTFVPTLSAEELSPQVEAIASAIAGVEVHARHQATVVDLTRGEDQEPWYGGAGVETPGGTICSTGFGVYSPSANYKNFVTTAWHCGAGSYKTWYSHVYMGYASEGDGNAADDAIGIVPKNDQHSGGYVYVGPWNDSVSSAMQVSGSGGNNVGDYVCQSAANSGAHCNMRVAQVDRQIQGPNGVWRKFADEAVQTDPNDIAAINGDSGGPVVVTTDNASKLQARGTITSLEKSQDCAGRQASDGGTRTPACYHGMWYVPISQTLADMGWVLRTSNP